MEVQFWGVRGTFPSPGRDKVKYGGHTPCASIRPRSGEIVIVDAGTGIKDLGDRIVSAGDKIPVRITLFLTHFHLDHVIGFPFFAPLFSPDYELTIYAPDDPAETERYLGGLLAGRYFPIEIDDLKARRIFRKTPPEGLDLGGMRISNRPLRHPQGSLGYRFEEEGKSVVFATDTEHPASGIDEGLAAFASGASLLVYDATYTPEEYGAGKRGWGHSTWLAGTGLAGAADPGKLLLSHLNPDHPDDFVDGLEASARALFPRTSVARQGMNLIA